MTNNSNNVKIYETRGTMYRFRGIFIGLIGFGLFWTLGASMNAFVMSNTIEVKALPGRVDVPAPSTNVDNIMTSSGDRLVNGVEVSSNSTSMANRKYTWEKAKDNHELVGMFSLIENELDEYREGYLEAVGLHEIIIVDNIQNEYKQPVLGFSDPLAGEIYLNSLATSGDQSRAVIGEQTIHHEIGHFLAYSEYGYFFDRESGWSSLGAENLYGKVVNADQEYFPVDGYVSRYALTSASEDQAEVYSLIFTEQFQDRLKKEASKSELLRSKLEITYRMMNHADANQCSLSYRAVAEACR